MFRRFSLFDSSPPSSKLSINPPRPTDTNANRKSPIKSAIINTLNSTNVAVLSPTSVLYKANKKRTQSLDNSRNPKSVVVLKQQRSKSASVPPIINRVLPQSSSPTSNHWYSRLGNSFHHSAWARKESIIKYHVKFDRSSGEIILIIFFIIVFHIHIKIFTPKKKKLKARKLFLKMYTRVYIFSSISRFLFFTRLEIKIIYFLCLFRKKKKKNQINVFQRLQKSIKNRNGQSSKILSFSTFLLFTVPFTTGFLAKYNFTLLKIHVQLFFLFFFF